MAKNMFLYWGSGSIPCWKVMIALAEKGFEGYGQKLVSFDKNEHKCADILKLNPRGQVPTFKDGDNVINESGAICDYLEYKYKDQGNKLLPDDPELRGKVLQRVWESQNFFKMVIEDVVYYQFEHKGADLDEEYLKGKKKAATEELRRWEDYLKEEGPGSYLVGKDFTMADVVIFPSLAFAVRLQLNLAPFPQLKAYYGKVMDRPSVKVSTPPHWAGSTGKDFFEGV
ncbi:glutathione S-transferase A-like [Babylonia areolata]|uniref:glutathione S-transferase A-like n=1 Tax=Babylonia areolata TaxID=304850 RepID=UPI003FD62731